MAVGVVLATKAEGSTTMVLMDMGAMGGSVALPTVRVGMEGHPAVVMVAVQVVQAATGHPEADLVVAEVGIAATSSATLVLVSMMTGKQNVLAISTTIFQRQRFCEGEVCYFVVFLFSVYPPPAPSLLLCVSIALSAVFSSLTVPKGR